MRIRRRRGGSFLTLAATASMLLPNTAYAAERAAAASVEPAVELASGAVIDVVLGPNAELRGRLVDTQTAAVPGMEVVLVEQGREVARTTTGGDGAFQVGGLSGGTYEVLTAAGVVSARLWNNGTAPPSAKSELTLLVDRDLARGQGPGSQFWRWATNPWISAGLISAAIIVPIALSNNGPGS